MGNILSPNVAAGLAAYNEQALNDGLNVRGGFQVAHGRPVLDPAGLEVAGPRGPGF